MSRTIVYNFVGIKDYKIFAKNDLQPSPQVFEFAEGSPSPYFPKTKIIEHKKVLKELSFEDFLKTSNTVGFLVIKNDSIIYEKYFDNYDQSSIVSSFSIAKSYMSALIGFAIQEGYIKSVDEPVRKYIPELRPELEPITIKHLLQMTSGIKSDENAFNPFSQVAELYYGTDLRKAIGKLRMEYPPGTAYKYSSANTQLLGIVLERALKTKTLTQYLQEKIWTPLGMRGGSWSVDDSGMEKAFCCLNSTARDFAKFGRFYLREGNWEGKQLLNKNWIKESTTPDTTNGSAWFYKYQWRLITEQDHDYVAQGALGQFIYVNPAKDIIIVRLGKTPGYRDWRGLFSELSNQLSPPLVPEGQPEVHVDQ